MQVKATLTTEGGITLDASATLGTSRCLGEGGITGFALDSAVRILVVTVGTTNHDSGWSKGKEWFYFKALGEISFDRLLDRGRGDRQQQHPGATRGHRGLG